VQKSAHVVAAPVLGLALYLVGVEILTATLRAHGHAEPSLFVVLRTAGWFGWLGWWYISECRARGVTPLFAMGLFLPLAWPLIMVHQLFLKERKMALLKLLIMIVIYATAKLAGLVMYALQAS
jgi:hypothetical protein